MAFRYSKLAKGIHRREEFFCGEPTLDRYLKKQATQDIARKLAAVYVLNPVDDHGEIVGYYTLSAFTITLSSLPEELSKKLPKHDAIPATLIGRLARSNNYRGKGVGELLLFDALKRSYEMSQRIGSFAVVVDAIDQRAQSFYQHYGFTAFTEHSKRLFLPMKSISGLFS